MSLDQRTEQGAFVRLLLEALDLGDGGPPGSTRRPIAEICPLLGIDVLYTVALRDGNWVKTAFGPSGELGAQVLTHLAGVARHVLSRRSRFLETRVPLRGAFHRHQDGWPGLDVGSYIALPIHRLGKCHGVLVLLRSQSRSPFTVEDLSAAELIADGLAIRELNVQRLAEVERLARTDSVTTLPNQRELRDILRKTLLRSRRLDLPLSLVLVEVDPGGRVALRAGPVAITGRLRGVADSLARSIRGSDYLAHQSGTTLALVLPETSRDGSHDLITRLRQILSREGFGTLDRDDAGCCWGIASSPENGSDVTTLINAAADALHADLRGALGLPSDPAQQGTPADPDSLAAA